VFQHYPLIYTWHAKAILLATHPGRLFTPECIILDVL
jgi:death-on-curing family protein